VLWARGRPGRGRADARGSRNNSKWDNSLDRRQNVAQSVSQVLFCFPTLGVHVLSPYRDGRCCSASEPRKEKQKSYNYCSAVLMVHRFRSFLSVFTQLMRKIRHEVTRKLAAKFEALPPSPRLGAEVFERKHRDSLCCPGLLGKYFTFPKVQLIARQGKQRCHHCKNSCLLLMHL
jgi:hypothetical protein